MNYWQLIVRSVLIRINDKLSLESKSDIIINPKELILIKGKSGEGKTTFALSLSGFYPPQNGCILFNGKNIYSIKREKIMKVISYFPQEFFSIGESEKKIYEFINSISPNKSFKIRFIKFLKKFHLKSSIIRKDFNSISLGEKQRIFLSIILAKNSLIYILDEPDSSLDICSKYEFLQILRDIIKKKEITFIIISHKIFPNNFFSKIIKIENGKISIENN